MIFVKNLIFAALLLAGLSAQPLRAEGRIDSLLGVLDRTLEQRPQFEADLRLTIATVRSGLIPSLPDNVRYRVNKQLIDLYRPYIYDSAMFYVAENRLIAKRMEERNLINANGMDYCNILLSGGMYHEAVENLRTVPRDELSGDLLIDYWQACEQTYHHMSIYTAGSSFEEHYRTLSRAYVDSLAEVIPVDSDRYFALSRIYLNNHDNRMARAMLLGLLDKLRSGSHDYAIVAATLSDTYSEHDERELEQKIELLTESAIADVRSNVKEYVSLSSLGGLLYLKGDVERAYRYGVISMEDANFYNARLRRVELSKIFPIIEQAYKKELDSNNRRLKRSIIMVSLFAVSMLVLIAYGTRQTIILRRIRRKLLLTNDRLVESGRMKEEYLGRFLSMCSSYINRLERYQQIVHLRLTAGRVDEVRAMVRSSDVINQEIEEFYRSFDNAFLRLYPNFPTDLNSLLVESEKIKTQKEGALTTEERIYALVRLGISKPADIAKFLRYSENTVYTYRHKMKSKARNKETFERDILNIGF
jgi:DNA-binding CsgD family transcriptional regulator